jgi:hypothetical protein
VQPEGHHDPWLVWLLVCRAGPWGSVRMLLSLPTPPRPTSITTTALPFRIRVATDGGMEIQIAGVTHDIWRKVEDE